MIKYLLLALIPIVLIAACTQIVSQAPVTTQLSKDEVSILDDQIPTIVEEQLNAVSVEDPTFLSDTQDNIASDMSIFFYD